MTSGTFSAGPAEPEGQPGCPDTARLAALLRAGTRTRAGVEDDEIALHLEACEACRRRLDELAGGAEWLSGLPPHPAAAPPSPTDETRVGMMPPILQAVMEELRHLHQPAQAPGAAPAAAAEARGDEDADFLEPCNVPGYIGKFGTYLVVEVVGRGGMGVVLKAHDPALDRIVAIKALSPNLAASASARRRFVREAQAAAAVSHEHVVTIHAVDEAVGRGGVRLPYLVMQFVSGRSVEARLREDGPLRLEEILRIGMQAAAGLAAAHAQGLVHRDVKPANIMLENGVSRVKLTDFGLARAADDAAITITGQVTGTPHYMAPEQARGERVDHRADLFSLGGVLYALCTGRPPFVGSDPLTTLRKVCEEQPVPVRQVNEDVPPWLAEVVERLMQKDPAARPQTADEVAEELGRHLARLQFSGLKSWEQTGTVGGLTPVPAAKGTRAAGKRRKLAVLAGIIVAAAGGALWVTQSGILARDRDVSRASAASAAGADARPSASAEAAASAVAAPGEGRFAVLGAGGGETRLFGHFADAVRAAESGATVEVRHDGVIDTPTIDLGRKALRVRAARGYLPVFEQPSRHEPVLATQAPLVLEGLTFHGRPGGTSDAPTAGGDFGPTLLISSGGPLYVTNCRFTVRAAPAARAACVRVSDAGTCVIRNSELHALRSAAVQWASSTADETSVKFDHVVATSRVVVEVRKARGATATLAAARCSFVTGALVSADEVFDPANVSIDLADDVLAARVMFSDPRDNGGRGRFAEVPVLSAGTVFDYVTPEDPDIAALPAAANLEIATGLPDPAGTSARPPPPNRPGLRRASFIDGRVQFSRDVRAVAGQGRFPDVTDFQVQWVKLATRGIMNPRRLATLGARLDVVGPGGPYETFRRSTAYETWQREAEAALRGSVPGPASAPANP